MSDQHPVTILREATTPGGARATRERVLLAAMEAFSARGYDGATARWISRTSGTNLAAINYHFGSKAGVYRAVVRRAFEEVEALLDARFGRAIPAEVEAPAETNVGVLWDIFGRGERTAQAMRVLGRLVAWDMLEEHSGPDAAPRAIDELGRALAERFPDVFAARDPVLILGLVFGASLALDDGASGRGTGPGGEMRQTVGRGIAALARDWSRADGRESADEPRPPKST